MPNESSILAAIKPMPYQGMNLLNDDWPNFLESLSNHLKESGFEHEKNSPELIIFSFPKIQSAIAALLRVSNKLRKEFRITGSNTKLPMQFILHLNKEKTSLPALFSPEADEWEMLHPETLYITRTLKPEIEILLSRQQLPPCTIKNEGKGIYEMELKGSGHFPSEHILAFRSLPIKGDGVPCFYCEMRSHKPTDCPSRFLTMKDNGLAAAGYLTFKQLNIIYKKAFTNPTQIIDQLSIGLKSSQLRKDPYIMVYVAFMDISRIYQPRFLLNIAFSIYNQWDAIFNSNKLKFDNNNLKLGLDCLRVKQYGRAEELLRKECHHKSAKRFYATVGLAFLALERGRMADMRSHLEIAANFAVQEKDRLYAMLLLSKYHALNNETWKARDLIKNALTIRPDCQEVIYRKIQLEVKGSFEETAFGMLRSLMVDQRQFYVTVLMDPTLVPIQTKVEDILLAQYHTLGQSAQENLALAKHEMKELTLWFDDNDQQMLVNIKTLQNLEKFFARKSYFDVLDVAAKAKILFSTSRSIREDKLNELYDRANRAQTKWNGYHHFWVSYPFPSFYKNFYELLSPLKKKIALIRNLAKKNLSRPYRRAVQLLEEVETALKDLEPIYQRMNYTSMLFSGGLIFMKKLFLTEITLALLATTILIALGFIPTHSPLSGLSKLTTDPLFHKELGSITGLLVAPFIALMLTIQRITK